MVCIAVVDRVRHCDRGPGSSFHVVEYNATTGDVIARFTAQGYSNSSTWSRGQAWGIYGFSNMYMHTQHPDYLTTARRLVLPHSPSR